MRSRKSRGSVAVARSSVFFAGMVQALGRVMRFRTRSWGEKPYQPPFSFSMKRSTMRGPATCLRKSK